MISEVASCKEYECTSAGTRLMGEKVAGVSLALRATQLDNSVSPIALVVEP